MMHRKLAILMDGYPRPRPNFESEEEYVQMILRANREARERVAKMSEELRNEMSTDKEGAQWLRAITNYDEAVLEEEARSWYIYNNIGPDNPLKIILDFSMTRS